MHRVPILVIAFGDFATCRQSLEPQGRSQYQRAVFPSYFSGSREGANIFSIGNLGMQHLAPPPQEQLPQNEGDAHLLGMSKQWMGRTGYATEDRAKGVSRQFQIREFRRRRFRQGELHLILRSNARLVPCAIAPRRGMFWLTTNWGCGRNSVSRQGAPYRSHRPSYLFPPRNGQSGRH